MKMSEKIKMTPEEIEKRLKMVESTCICRGCPTYRSLGEEDDYIAYCFPTQGKSHKIKTEKEVTTFTVKIDQELDSLLLDLKEVFNKQSKADVFRLSVALLKIAAQAKMDGQSLAVIDKNGEKYKEIVLV